MMNKRTNATLKNKPNCGKRVLLGIYFFNYFDNYHLVLQPGRSRTGTNPLLYFFVQLGHVVVQN